MPQLVQTTRRLTHSSANTPARPARTHTRSGLRSLRLSLIPQAASAARAAVSCLSSRAATVDLVVRAMVRALRPSARARSSSPASAQARARRARYRPPSRVRPRGQSCRTLSYSATPRAGESAAQQRASQQRTTCSASGTLTDKRWCGAVLRGEFVRLWRAAARSCRGCRCGRARARRGRRTARAYAHQRAACAAPFRRCRTALAHVGPLGLPCTSPCDEVGVIGLARQAQRVLQQRGASAGVAGVFAQPGHVERPARLDAHQRAAQVAGCDLAVCGDETQFAARGREHLWGPCAASCVPTIASSRSQ